MKNIVVAAFGLVITVSATFLATPEGPEAHESLTREQVVYHPVRGIEAHTAATSVLLMPTETVSAGHKAPAKHLVGEGRTFTCAAPRRLGMFGHEGDVSVYYRASGDAAQTVKSCEWL